MPPRDLTDEEWSALEGRLPVEPGRRGRPSSENRRFVNGVLHVLRGGFPWRELPGRYGKWNSVYVRFMRWSARGDWDAILEILVDLRLTDDWRHTPGASSPDAKSSARGGREGLARRSLLESAELLRRRPLPPARSRPVPADDV